MDTPKTVSVTAIAHHSYNAESREPGDVYDADPFYVESLVALGFAKRTADMTAAKPVAALSTKDLPAGRTRR